MTGSKAPASERIAQLDSVVVHTALCFLAMHHDAALLQATHDAKDVRFSKRVQGDCRRVARHHQEQLHQVGEQLLLIGGRNPYPRP